MSGVPKQGSLSERSLPDLLLDLAGTAGSGTLHLETHGTTAEIEFAEGRPVRCGPDGASPGVVEWLLEQGELAADAAERVKTTARAKECTPEQALLGLKLIGPAALVAGLRAVAARRLVALGRHDAGAFRFESAERAPEGAAALRGDPLPIVQEIVETHWRPDRMLLDLGDWSAGHVQLTEAGVEIAERLAARDGVAELLSKLDGTTALWGLLGSASRTGPIAALWVLARVGAIEVAPPSAGEEAPATQTDAPSDPVATDPTAPEPEIEIEIAGHAESTDAPSPEAAAAATGPGAEDDAVAELRALILDRHEQLKEIDHYSLLGLERDASAGQIKRAYLRAAKRFHPDALARLGLQEIKPQAGAVFTQIAKAQATLSDPESRRDYDAALDGHHEVDAAQIAQAEILFRKGEMLMRAGNFREAVDYVEASTELWPGDPAYHAAFGWCLYKNSPPDEARARDELQKAIELDDDFAEAHLRLGIVLKALGDADGAAKHTQRGKSLDANASA
ncbi:MAG: DnaJ domain-containing protein [Myxococcales bacterium]|nr:DnaJ domain-containing protein [Myxococcales bacterium]